MALKRVLRRTITVDASEASGSWDELVALGQPIHIEGFAKDWPIVKSSFVSSQNVIEFLANYYNGKSVDAFRRAEDGRYFYTEDMTALNFETNRVDLIQYAKEMTELGGAKYVGSTSVDSCLPGFRTIHPCIIDGYDPLVSIWLSNKSRVACHYDGPKNLAVCAAGVRKFTMFPPDQVENLYPGPIDFTPAGQAISLVDFESPDFERFPKFRDALGSGEFAELNAGDALYLPNLWWHQVEALDEFNVLINYWWDESKPFLASPKDALWNAILSIRNRPEQERRGWAALFNYYIFNDLELCRDHIPEHARGILGDLDDMDARRIRSLLLNNLNR